MKIKHTLFAIVLGKLLIIWGASLKINHLEYNPYSNYLLSAGLITIGLGVVAFLYKLSTHPKVKSFLNF